MQRENAVELMRNPDGFVDLAVKDFIDLCSCLNVNELITVKNVLLTQKKFLDSLTPRFLQDSKENIAKGEIIQTILETLASNLIKAGFALENINTKIEFIDLFIYDERTPEYFKKKRTENQIQNLKGIGNCSKCGVELNTKEEFDKHICKNKQKKLDSGTECPICGELLLKSDLDTHKCLDKEYYSVCTECGEELETKEDFEKHSCYPKL